MGYGEGDPGQDSKESSSRRGQFSSDKELGKDERRVSDEKSGKKYFVDRSIVCFCCGVKGHFKSECPDNVASVRKSGQFKRKIVQEKCIHPYKMTLDSGADHTVVRADLTLEQDYTGKSCRVCD